MLVAVAVAAVLGTAAVLLPRLGKEDAKGADGGSAARTPSSTAGSSAPPAFASFTGTWSGEVEGGGTRPVPERLLFQITEGGAQAEYVIQYRDISCRSKAWLAGGKDWKDGQTSFPYTPMSATEPDTLCPRNEHTLAVEGDVLRWRSAGATAVLRRTVTDPKAVDQYRGTWVTQDDGTRLELSIASALPGRQVDLHGGTDNPCVANGVVVAAGPDALLVGDTDPGGPEMGDCYGHGTFDIVPAGEGRLRVITNRNVSYFFTRTSRSPA